MALQSVAGLSNVLTTMFPAKYMQDVLFTDNPFVGSVAKSESFGGTNKRISLQYAPTSGGSVSFTTAQARQGGASYEGFLLTRAKDYSLFGIDNEALLAGQEKDGRQGLLSTMKRETNGAMNQIKRSIGLAMFRNGGGARGQVGSTSTTTLTLKNRAEVFNFEVGMYLDSSTTDGTSGSADGGSIRITAIDRSAGTLTAAGNWTAAGNFSDDDYIFREGDFGGVPVGLDGWLPATVTATAFFGVDRTTDKERLAGVRYVADAAKDSTVERTLVRASEEVTLMGGSPDVVYMHPLDQGVLRKEINAATTFFKSANAMSSKGPVANISYQYLEFVGHNGPMKIIGDRNCPRGVAYMLTSSTWELCSLGKCPRWLDTDGNTVLRAASADGVEGRIGLYGNLACSAPGYNARINIAGLPEIAADLA